LRFLSSGLHSTSCMLLMLLLCKKRLLESCLVFLGFEDGEVLQDSSAIKLVLGGVNPETPVEEAEKLGLQEVKLLKVHASDVGHEMVPVEHVVVELG
jgi:hypothetical protein